MKFNFETFKKWLRLQLIEKPDLYTEGAVNNVLNKIREGEKELRMNLEHPLAEHGLHEQTKQLIKEILGEST